MSQEELLTRDRVVQTALGLFMTQGFENTSIQAIIDAVGIAKGTFYHHFKSKDDLLVALVDSMMERIMLVCDQLMARTDLNALERFLLMFQQAGAIKIQDMGRSLPLLQQLKTGANQKLERQLALAMVRFTKPVFAKLIAQCKEEGYFKVRDPLATAEVIMALGMGMREPSLDLMIAALEGREGAVDELIALMDSINEAMERILGVEAGSLHIYDTQTIREALKGAAR